MRGLPLSKIIVTVVAILVVANIAVLLWPTKDGDNSTSISKGRAHRRRLPLISATNAPSVARAKIETAKQSMENRAASALQKVKIGAAVDDEVGWIDENGKPWPQEQKQLMRAISQASDDNDFKSLVSLSDLVMECTNDEIRERFVEELGWFGEQAVPELLGFMSDPNEEVAQAARDQWIDGVQAIDDDAEKAALLINVSKAMTDSAALEAFADELMGMDELLALQTIVDTIDSGTPQAVEAVKNMYETITGEEWSDVDAAEGWLQENYTPDDDLSDSMETAEVKDEQDSGAEVTEEKGSVAEALAEKADIADAKEYKEDDAEVKEDTAQAEEDLP